MALRDTVADCYARVVRLSRPGRDKMRLARVLGGFVLSTATFSRTHKTDVTEWELLSETAASAYLDCHAGDCNTIYTAEEYDRVLRAWRLTREVDSVGVWELDTAT